MKDKSAAAYREWLRDNHYLIEREGRAVLRELRRANPKPGDFTPVLAICRALCAGDALPDGAALAAAMLRARCKSAGVALVPLALRLALIENAIASAREKEDPTRVKRISTAVTGLRAIPDIDFAAVLEQASPLERCLRRDPVYPRMEEGSRAVYRHLLSLRAKKSGRGEEEEAGALLERAAGAFADSHVGTALLKGAYRPKWGAALLLCETLLPLLLAGGAAFTLQNRAALWAWVAFPLLCLPLTALGRVLLEPLFLRGTQSIPLPRMELNGVVPPEGRTLITVSSLLPCADLGKRMEELYMSNGGANVSVCMLADLKAANAVELPGDEADLHAARAETERLCAKYGGGFVLAVRHRTYSPTMGSYAGRERKRGAIGDLVNAIDTGETAPFRLLCGDLVHLRDFKYILALDADTRLPLDTVQEMVAAALHPSNRPQFDPVLGRVVRGYGILAPHVELDLESARATPFAHAMAGEGGSSPYENRVSERYQDLFGCGIFAGKGLIDVEAFAMLERARPFPAEQVLSHDILEGGYLRTGFLADVHVADGCPARQGSYFTRQERWVRGDWQNIAFLRKKRGLPRLSRYQLLDNLRRSLVAPACLLAILASLLAPKEIAWVLMLAGVLGVSGGQLLSALRCLFSGGLAMLSRDYYSGGLPAALGDLTRLVLQLVVLAQEAWTNTCAAARALWRRVTRKKQLEWTTAAQGERDKAPRRAILALWPSLLAGGLLLAFGGAGQRLAGIAILANLIFAPLSGREKKRDKPELTQEERSRVHEYCALMWNYFETYCTADQHYLPPDNVQEAPVFRVASRSSPTNIGLYLLCILAARDLDLIDTPGMIERLIKTLSSIERLEKWNGNLLNWYDTRTLCPLEPRYVSTVDTGNFLVAIRTLRIGLEEYATPVGAACMPPEGKDETPGGYKNGPGGKNAAPADLSSIIQRLRTLEETCDLCALYNPRRKLFHIGLDLSTGRASGSYYDLLMSEARMTSYYAIAARIVPKKHWGALGRTLARRGRFTGPVSWTGTMFEYFMPYLFLPAPRGTLGYEALRFCLSCQKAAAQGDTPLGRRPQLPWGRSESGFYAFDPGLNYQYKAHGVQKLGLRRGLDGELVSSPYSSFLAMQLAPKSALENLRRFERMELLGACGFYEAADATPARVNGQDYAVVRSFMAHHVGMSMLAALNTLQDGILRRRFLSDGGMAAAKGLLLERIPDRAAVFRDVGLRDTPRPRERVSTARQVFTRADPASPRAHLLSNGEWSCVVTDCGAGASFYRGVSIYRHSADLLRRPCGVLAALRGPGGPPVSITPAPHYNAAKARVEFASTEALHCIEHGGVTALMRTRVHPRLPAEHRQFILKNTGKQPVRGSLWVCFEPSLAPPREEHPAFSQLFLTDAYDAAREIAVFTRRKGEMAAGEALCLAAGWGRGVKAICERSREKALRRGLPFGGAILEGGSAGGGTACAAFEIAYRMQPGESREYSLYLCAGTTPGEAVTRLQQLRAEPQPGGRWAACPFREGELPAVLAQRVLPRLLFYGPISPAQATAREKTGCARRALWPLGLSGEEPYIYLPVEEDVSAALPWLRLFRRLRAAGLPCALALGYHEGGDYDSPICAALREALRREGCAHLENNGLRLVNLRRADHASLEALEAYAAHIGGRDEEPESRIPGEGMPLPILAAGCRDARPCVSTQGARVGQGTFLPGKFVIDKPPLSIANCQLSTLNSQLSTHLPPTRPWSLPLCNPAFGTLVSDSALGFTWAVNARENKLSPWHSDPCADNSGEMLLMKFGNQVFDLLAGARCAFSPEMARWSGEIHGIDYTVTCRVPSKGLCKRVEITLTNTTDRTLTPALAYYLEPVLGVRREPLLPIRGERLPDGVLLQSPDAAVRGYCALLMPGGAEFTCASRPAFLKGNWSAGGAYPQGDPCAAVGRRLQLQPGGESHAEFVLTWGACKTAALTAHLVAEYAPSETHGSASAPNTQPSCGETHSRASLQQGTDGSPKEEPIKLAPAGEMPRSGRGGEREMLRTWLPHQVLAGRLWGRAGHAQCGGAWGFRDQLQDVLALIDTRPEIVRGHLARCAAAQFPEGDALHWWHRLPGQDGVRGTRTRCADDYLWLAYVCAEYVLGTGDHAFLETKIPFREGEPLAPEEAERYAVYYLGRERASLYGHCLRCADRALGLLGAHGLPLMRGGDWNDGMNRVGAGGAGESVWLGMFLIMVLERTAKLCEFKQDFSRAEEYRARAGALRGAIDGHCWAGNRYLRAFWDDGEPLGGRDGEPCGIDLLPQCFASLCDMPDKERVNSALDTAMAALVEEEHGIVRLLKEPFTHSGKRAGYINDYPPGARENGGQYTHAAMWLCLALLKEGRGEEAHRVLELLNPAIFCQDERRMEIYRGEPYFLAGDVSGAPGGEGRAGWTIYTGAAGWMMQVMRNM
ncbi:MAG: hypothetical protein FWE98_05875 [Oscillospiraceae bacterium]|nr:hypothetical protein [Oscillospiraceae bacterium]